MTRYTVVDSPIGALTLVANDAGVLCGLHMGVPSQGASLESFGKRTNIGFERAIEQIDEYFAGKRTEFELELAPQGNAFQVAIWKQLQLIPFGKTRSYGEIAEAVGDRTLARSVGSACGSNPIAVIIPCHRVIGADGSLVGFGGGLKRKEFLLHHENPQRPIALPLF
jgi:methylated-DNA-[protein]-cysteine S-methyltransferase